MADALLQVMKEKPFPKITVNEITEIAGVNRSTWFRNFNDKNEAITFKLIQLWHRWANEHSMKERRRYTLDNAEDFFAFAVVFIDAIHYSVRDNNVIRKLAAYVILGINCESRKEVLSIQIGENESARYWLSVLNELRNRGVYYCS